MNLATAAGFCCGITAAPVHCPGEIRDRHLMGDNERNNTPFYLPVQQAYTALNSNIIEALLDGLDPIPAECRPAANPNECFHAPFADWCRGLEQALNLRQCAWQTVWQRWPQLEAEFTTTVETLTWFADHDRSRRKLAGREGSDQRMGETTRRIHTDIDRTVQRLYRLARPLLANIAAP